MDSPFQQLVDIGNRAMCTRVRGQGPTVVLEAYGGGEGTTGIYGGLEERLTAFATVLTYDRAGSGRSDGPARTHIAEMADDLDAVIRSLGCATPVVVVGWSTGGSVAEVFAARHPDKVAGLVLLDPAQLLTRTWIGQQLLTAYLIALVLLASLPVYLGFFRTRAGRSLVRRTAHTAHAGTSPEGLDYLENLWSNPPRARWSLMRVVPLLFGRFIREATAALDSTSLPDVPVRVLVPRVRTGVPRTYARRVARRLDAAHLALAERFPRGKLDLVDKTGGLLPIDRPDVVIAAIRDVLAQKNPPA
jgi:pimeloyl-ACP methyl ester carboxylesterase